MLHLLPHTHKNVYIPGHSEGKWSSVVKIKVLGVANCHLLDMTLEKSLNLSKLQFPYLLF